MGRALVKYRKPSDPRGSNDPWILQITNSLMSVSLWVESLSQNEVLFLPGLIGAKLRDSLSQRCDIGARSWICFRGQSALEVLPCGAGPIATRTACLSARCWRRLVLSCNFGGRVLITGVPGCVSGFVSAICFSFLVRFFPLTRRETSLSDLFSGALIIGRRSERQKQAAIDRPVAIV